VCGECWASIRLAPQLIERNSIDHLITWSCAVDRYEGRMKEIIHALKYERRRSISPRLGALMRECGAPLLCDAAAVVPVPLHPRREYERGFNQAEDLAIHLGPPVVRLLQRVRHTQSQIELPKHQRQQNVRDAFDLNPAPGSRPSTALGAALSLSKGRFPVPGIVVLVDDVSTTGSTLDACARVLKAAGVQEVRALTAARVVNARR
jgi:ComF family protein